MAEAASPFPPEVLAELRRCTSLDEARTRLARAAQAGWLDEVLRAQLAYAPRVGGVVLRDTEDLRTRIALGGT